MSRSVPAVKDGVLASVKTPSADATIVVGTIAWTIASSMGETMLPPPGFMHLGLAELIYEWNRLDEAAVHLKEGIERGQRGGDVKIWLMAYLLLAKVKHA